MKQGLFLSLSTERRQERKKKSHFSPQFSFPIATRKMTLTTATGVKKKPWKKDGWKQHNNNREAEKKYETLKHKLHNLIFVFSPRRTFPKIFRLLKNIVRYKCIPAVNWWRGCEAKGVWGERVAKKRSRVLSSELCRLRETFVRMPENQNKGAFGARKFYVIWYQ